MINFKNFFQLLIAVFAIGLFTSCDEDPLSKSTFTYKLHNGQTVPSAPYAGIHPSNYEVSLELEELENGNTRITVNLENTVQGETYHIHAHDAADAATTPNGTPYNESPNGDVLAIMIMGTGGSASGSQETTMSFESLTTDYEGFFVSHDPLQAVSTTDISTYLVVGSFARDQGSSSFSSSSFSYDFNTGQVAPTFAYTGTHATNLGAMIQVDELADDRSRITIWLMNTMNGETYPTHAHDMADPTTTPNGTPYIESPNSDVFAASIQGNGSTAGVAKISSMNYTEITTSYDGFFVVHDPLQAVTTVDPTTYVLLGVFAR